jgi:predicted 3-demethylubiquinone-9 3-methyltransferase (glyoxalase superfamily)
MRQIQKISPCLWFDHQAEEAASFYTSIFKNSKIGRISRYGEAGRETHRKPPGSVLTVAFELDGQAFIALNGGPIFKFNEAISLQVNCETQEEIDYYWEKLGAGGDEKAQQCGWLKDKYDVSWQIVPTILPEMASDPNPAKFGERLRLCARRRPRALARAVADDRVVGVWPGARRLGSNARDVCAQRDGGRPGQRLADVLRATQSRTVIEFGRDVLDDLVLAWACGFSRCRRHLALVLYSARHGSVILSLHLWMELCWDVD